MTLQMHEEMASAEASSSFQQWLNTLIAGVSTEIMGKQDAIAQTFLALFSQGHVLFEDNPGTGKTTLAKTVAASLGGTWNRIQFTPDLLPTDITGGSIFNQQTSTFEFRQGPIFANVVLADEINRASAKTQSALLQVMEEGQVTVDGVTYEVPKPFIVIATQNPIEQAGTYRLPEAQLDRFMVKLTLGYPDHRAEVEMLGSRLGGPRQRRSIEPIIQPQAIEQLGDLVRSVHVEQTVQSYIVDLCAFTRSDETTPEAKLGISPRGAVALMRMAQAVAASQARAYVSPDDVKSVAHSVMAHRILLRAEAELNNVTAKTLIDRALNNVTPPAMSL